MLNRHVERRLTPYADGELSAADAARVDTHLATCARCRSTLDEIRFSTSLVRQLSTFTAPPSVWNGIEGTLSRPERHGWFSAGVTLRWAAACVLVLAVAAGTYRW